MFIHSGMGCINLSERRDRARVEVSMVNGEAFVPLCALLSMRLRRVGDGIQWVLGFFTPYVMVATTTHNHAVVYDPISNEMACIHRTVAVLCKNAQKL